MNETKASGEFDVLKGKVKQSVGETFNDQSMANSGSADQVKGHAEQAWGTVKDKASDISSSHSGDDTRAEAQHTGHNIRESVTSAAENAKNSIERGVENLKEKIKH